MSRARETARLISNDTFRIDSNNAVGFGSTTPDAMFDINAGLTVAGIITASGGISGAVTGSTSQITVADESSDTTCFPVFVTAASGNLEPKSGSNLTFNSNTGTLETTNVTVTGDLTVQGTTTTLDTDLIGVDKVEVGANNSTVGLAVTQSGSGAIIAAYDGASEVFRVDDGGNFGIGTDNPQQKLHVKGTIRLDGTVNAINDNYSLIYQNSSGSVDYGLQVKHYQGDTGDADAAIIIGGNSSREGNIVFYRDVSGTNTETARFDENGRLGIGTNNPGTNLEVIGGIKAKNTTGSSTLTIQAKNDQLSGVHFSDDAATLGKIEYFHSDNSLRFNTNGSERLAILSSGYVGIGTNVPATSLHAFGAVKLEGDVEITPTNSGLEGGHITLRNPDKSSVGAQIDVSSANTFRIFQSNNNSQMILGQLTGTGGTISLQTQGVDRLKIDSSGRVLIGTSNALTTTDASKAKLVINGDTDGSGFTGRIAINNSVATVLTNYKLGEIHFSGQAAGNTAGSISCIAESNWNTGGDTTDNPGRLVFSTTADGAGSPTERMRIDSTGAVTKATNPCLKTVSGDTYASTNNLFTSPAVSVLQANASINIGNTSWTTTGTNAYSFVCPVTGIYAVHAHISLGNITENARTIWSMAYTLGGGNFPLATYVEVIDVVVDDYMNYSYYEDWYFTAGTRVAMGKNGTGYQAGYGLRWGIRLVQ